MNFNNRSDYLQGILNALNGLYYYLNDFNSTGILYYDVGDLYNVQIGENTYQCLMLNDEINVTTGIEEIIHTDMPQKSETDYDKADKTDIRINKTYLIVDKQNQKIESVVNNVSAQNNKIAQITQTVDEINSKIQDIADITTYGESDRAYVELEGINQSEPVMVKVHPTSENISYLYPREDLYPDDLLFMPDRIIRFTRTYEENGEALTEDIDYELPDDLLRYSDTVYDEFYLNYESQTCQVIKRCAYNADGTVKALGTEVTTNYPYPQIILGEGNYTISLPGYDFAYLYTRLMAKNIYTEQFYTKIETDSKINQKADEINLGVNQRLTNYSTTNQMNSAINLKANEITSQVSNTYETKGNAQTNYSRLTQTANSLQSQISSNDTDISTLQQTAQGLSSTVSQKVGNNEIISKINQSSEAVTINANKINLSGKTINLTSDNIAITSTNFSVNKNGTMTCSNANVVGGKIKLTGGTQNNPNFKVSNSSKETSIIPGAIYLDDGFYANSNNGAAYLYADSDGGGITVNNSSSGKGTYIRPEYVKSPRIEQTSLETEKKDFEKFKNALEIIKNIDIYKYHLNSEKDTDKKHIGFVIGDKFNYSKEVTSNENNGVDIYSFVSLCCQAINELQEEIQELKGGNK